MATFKVSIILPDSTIHTEEIAADRYEKGVDGDICFYRSSDQVKVASFRTYSFITYTDAKDPDGTPALPDKTATDSTVTK